MVAEMGWSDLAAGRRCLETAEVAVVSHRSRWAAWCWEETGWEQPAAVACKKQHT